MSQQTTLAARTTSAIEKQRDTQRNAAKTALMDALHNSVVAMYTREEWADIMLEALHTTPALLDCSPQSLITAFRSCMAAGLRPSTVSGHCYIIPYKQTATFVLGYKGMLELIHRTGEVKDVQAAHVYSSDRFRFERGVNPVCAHEYDPFADRGELRGVYACVRTTSGGLYTATLSVAELEAIRRRSASPDKGPWVTDTAAMQLVAVLRRVTSLMPKIWIPDERSEDSTRDNELPTDTRLASATPELATGGTPDELHSLPKGNNNRNARPAGNKWQPMSLDRGEGN